MRPRHRMGSSVPATTPSPKARPSAGTFDPPQSRETWHEADPA
jgi:hypothetical protein